MHWNGWNDTRTYNIVFTRFVLKLRSYKKVTKNDAIILEIINLIEVENTFEPDLTRFNPTPNLFTRDSVFPLRFPSICVGTQQIQSS